MSIIFGFRFRREGISLGEERNPKLNNCITMIIDGSLVCGLLIGSEKSEGTGTTCWKVKTHKTVGL